MGEVRHFILREYTGSRVACGALDLTDAILSNRITRDVTRVTCKRCIRVVAGAGPRPHSTGGR